MRLIVYLIIMLSLVGSSAEAAKFAGEPFSLGVGGRGLALGGAVVAGPFDATSAYWNPAGMNRLRGRQVTAMHAETFGSLLNHDYLAYIDARSTEGSAIKAFGFYLYYLGGGGIKITELNAFGRPTVVREESHGDFLLAASLSGQIAKRVDFGLSAKIIYRNLGTESGKGLTLDAGLAYQLTNRINLGLMVSDISTGFIRFSGGSLIHDADDPDSSYLTEANYETIYPTVKPGIMIEQSHHQFTGRVVASGDIRFESIKSAAQYWSGPVSLDTHFGAEIDYRGMLFGRSGFDIGRYTAGGGIDVRNITVDFAYLHHSQLDETFRVSAGYRF